jgi:hypothetical protein
MAGALFFLTATVQSRKVHDKPHAEKQKQKNGKLKNFMRNGKKRKASLKSGFPVQKCSVC